MPSIVTLDYAQLSGGLGTSVRYRAPRLRRRDLGPEIPPGFEISSRPVRIHDLSMTGASFFLSEGEAPHPGAVVPALLRVGEVAVFEANAQVVRTERGPLTKVAVRFLDRMLDLREVREEQDRLSFEESVRRGLGRYAEVPAGYRAACCEAALFLNHWRALLDARERRLREARASAADFASVERAALEPMRREWRRIRLEANRHSAEIADDSPAFHPAKRYTQLQLTPLLRPSPFLWRCFEKPLGYPGDFVAMGWMYDRPVLAETLFGRVLDQLGFDERLAATVPDRKELLVRHLSGLLEERSEDAPIRVLNLGAGPCREIEEFLQGAAELPEMTFVLIDQDEQALAHAHETLRRAALRHGDRVRIECRFLSFRQLFASPEQVAEVEGQDLVYSAGLFDYLPEPVARDLLRRCARLLRPGGRLSVGNAAQAPDVRWIPEFVLDWHMIYRSEAEMERLAGAVDVPVETTLERDDSAAWHFLTLRRRLDAPAEERR